MKKILIIVGHPNSGSLNGSFADAYAKEVKAQGAEVEVLKLGELTFDPILKMGYKDIQLLEPDLERAQSLIRWADHLVWFYPSWWGNAPALLKGFVDRVFLPGFAFKYRKDSPFNDKLLTGKTARIILTMDAPSIWNWLMYHNANIHWLKNATLKFCGVKVKKTIIFDKVRYATEAKIQQWIAKIGQIAKSDV